MTGGVYAARRDNRPEQEMIEVTVRLNAGLRRHRPALGIGEALPLRVPEGTDLRELLNRILQIPPNEVAFPMVNGVKCDLDKPLVGGDRVAFWPPVAGG
jgi:molybdopterin converting factor small subunit